MKPNPTEVAPVTGARVEFEVQFSRGPKGRRRVAAVETPAPVPKAEPMSPLPAPVATPRPAAPPSPAVAPAPPYVATPTPEASPHAVQPAPAPRVLKIALLLVLGHHFEHLVRDGVVKDYAEIARRTGLTRARVTQIVNLTLLAPEIQEEILIPSGNEAAMVERQLRDLVAIPEWSRQRERMHHGFSGDDNREVRTAPRGAYRAAGSAKYSNRLR